MAQAGHATDSRQLYKDKVLDETARMGNVAQFVSFDPGLRCRFSRVRVTFTLGLFSWLAFLYIGILHRGLLVFLPFAGTLEVSRPGLEPGT